MPHDVFISYSSRDKTTADGVCARLEDKQVRCWIAPRDMMPGKSYGAAIIEAIEASGAMVLVFSSNSNVSPYVMREVERAVHHGIPILPFRIEDVIPTKDMEFFLSVSHWLDAWTPPLEDHLQRLADTVQVWLGRGGATVPPKPPPPEPGEAPKTLSTYVARVRAECAERFSTDLIRPDRVYVPQSARAIRATGADVDLASVASAFWAAEQRRVAILGNYGMGKSYFAWRLALDQLGRLEEEREQKIPILFPLTRFNYQLAADSGGAARDIVQQVLDYAVSLDFPNIDRKLMVRWIEDGVVGIILDGLDELALPRTASWQDVLLPLSRIERGHLLITSRTAYLQDPVKELSSYDGYELLPWGEREWQKYLEASAEALEPTGGAAPLVEAVARRPKLSSLTTRPLWCYMIVAIADQVPTLEDLALSGLYQQFLDSAVRRRPLMDALLSLAWQYCAMERLAEECIRTDQDALEESKLLSLLSRLFESVGHGELQEYLTKQVRQYAFLNCDLQRRYNFGHKSFQDYFAASGTARWIAEQATGSSSGPPQFTVRSPLVAERRLTDEQSSFLAGIFQDEWIQKSLALVPEAAAKHLHSKTLMFLQREVSKDELGTVMRGNLFRLYLDVLRADAAAGTTELSCISLKKVNLSGMDLSGCVFDRVDFTDAILSHALLRGSRFPGCTFFGAVIDGADFTGADLADADFVGVELGDESPILTGISGVEQARISPRERRMLSL